MTHEAPINLRLSNADDVLTLVPYLLGFHPRESVVILVCRDGRLVLTARCDLALCFDEAQCRARLACLPGEDRRFLLVAYAEDAARADDALGRLEVLLDPRLVLRSLHTDGVRLRTRGHPGSQPHPPEAAPLGEVCARAGLRALPSRTALAELVAGPSGETLVAARRAAASARRRLAGLSAADRVALADDLVGRGLTDAAGLDAGDVAVLHRLLLEVPVRDHVWAAMTRPRADDYARLCLRLCRDAPQDAAVPVLALTALATWLAGDGALMVCCLERGLRLDPGNSLLHLLEDINLIGLPPTAWDRVGPQVRAAGAPQGVLMDSGG